MTTTPDYYIPPGITTPVDLMIIVPYVDGMLREETMAAVAGSGEAYLNHPLSPDDPYDYASAFRTWWNLPMDLIIIEQDMAPTPEQIKALIHHPDPWVTAPYHVGNGRYATGLGFCKIAHRLRTGHPMAGVNISLDPRDQRDLITWTGLNENVHRHLTRLGERETALGFTVEHLHYPVAGDG
jgi:hypothetical protein